MFFNDGQGHALYFPYGLEISIPAMLSGHLTIAGAVEAAVTGLIFAWLQRSSPELLQMTGVIAPAASRTVRIAWAALVVLMVLTPLGLLAPGTAWGEWGREELQALGLGYVPAGFDRFANIWSAPLSGYDIPALNNPTVAYILAALMGVGLIVLVLFALGWIVERVLRRAETQAPSTG